eukprot:GEMP01067086.1.p1 GENE.GEMP01067086.1~~GEMP01067086.1.p1  ORF type:complete len:196 (+),score=33.71 GEMP01067086.1:68-589(+)
MMHTTRSLFIMILGSTVVFLQGCSDDEKTVKLTVILNKAENLVGTDSIGEIDPYVTMFLGGKDMKKSNVVDGGGSNLSFKEEKFIWNYKPGGDSTLLFKVMDEELITDELVGKCGVNILGLQGGVYKGSLDLFHGPNHDPAGKLYVKITSDIKPAPSPLPTLILTAAEVAMKR